MGLILLLAAQEAQARELLDSLDKAYRAAKAVSYEATVDGEQARRAPDRVTLTAAIRERSHLRLELAFTSQAEPARSVIVAAGRDLAEYRSDVHEHRVQTIDKPIDGSMMSDPVGHAFFGGSLAALFPLPAEGGTAEWAVARSADARVVTLTLKQQQSDATATSTYELTVAADGPAVRRWRTETTVNGEMVQRREVSYGSLEFDPALPDALFAFAPPEGSRRVDEFTDPSYGRLQTWVGKELPDVALKAADGSSTTLAAATSGAVTLVCLWTTLFPDCLVAVNHFNVVAEKFGDDGVRIVLVTTDSAEQLGTFLRSRETQPRWATPIYRAEALPEEPYAIPIDLPATFLLDKSGVVRHIFIGPAKGSVRYTRVVADVLAGP